MTDKVCGLANQSGTWCKRRSGHGGYHNDGRGARWLFKPELRSEVVVNGWRHKVPEGCLDCVRKCAADRITALEKQLADADEVISLFGKEIGDELKKTSFTVELEEEAHIERVANRVLSKLAKLLKENEQCG